MTENTIIDKTKPVSADEFSYNQYRHDHTALKSLDRKLGHLRPVHKGRPIGTDNAMACIWINWSPGQWIDKGEVLVNKRLMERILK